MYRELAYLIVAGLLLVHAGILGGHMSVAWSDPGKITWEEYVGADPNVGPAVMSLRGTVRNGLIDDPIVNPIVKAQITLDINQNIYLYYTDSDGRYSIPLTVGVEYGITVGATGFKTLGPNVSVKSAQHEEDFLLTPEWAMPVYRFWSGVKSRHFYTISESEKSKLIAKYSHVWTYEGLAYYALEDSSKLGSAAVYRFWSGALSAHFYTIKVAERDKLINLYSDVWTYEGPVFYAYPPGPGSFQPSDANPVYRFWSDSKRCHFYTMSEREKNKLITTYSYVWTYEGIAWYAYGSP